MTGYSKQGLRDGIKHARHNIKVLEKAIEDERQTIATYRTMIDDLERAEKEKAEAEANVVLVVDNTDGVSE